jgi:AcrR family transcriptional regulator
MPRSRRRSSGSTTAAAQDEERLDRRTEIREKASQVFLKYGYKKTTIEDIAKACGLGKAALYYYYSSKEEILAEAVRAESERLLAQMRAAADATDDPRLRLAGVVKTRMQFMHDKLLDEAIAEELWELLPAAYKLRQKYFAREVQIVEQVLANGIRRRVFKPCDTSQVALLFITAMQGVELHCAEIQHASPVANDLDAMINLFFDGLCR